MKYARYRASVQTHQALRRPCRPPVSVVVVPDAGAQRRAEIEQELLLARDIQQGLLLEAVPRLPGWEISAVSLPARDLGGDLYDFLALGGAWRGIMIGDVSGKGLPAALRMAVARTVFRHDARRGDGPAATLAAVNRSVISEIPQGMITMLYALLDTQAGVLRFANAGHNYPVIVNGTVDEIELSGMPLGVDGDSEYNEACTVIAPGTLVLLYTDGVVEAEDARGELYGYERLTALLADHAPARPRTLVARLLQELRSWNGGGQADDVTLVALRRRLASPAAELRTITDEVLGVMRAHELWGALVLPGAGATGEDWAAAVPEIGAVAQARFGRGLGRDLLAQLRDAVEDYRDPGPVGQPADQAL